MQPFDTGDETQGDSVDGSRTCLRYLALKAKLRRLLWGSANTDAASEKFRRLS
jgi:hypothetical protein